ncbi:MAG: hypothetical protein AAF921_11295 [Cyanobacteria bacterium P01_D01_bin.44]
MPQYSVDEVLNIIKSLTADEQVALRSKLPAIWAQQQPVPIPPKVQQSQSIGNISIGSGSTFDINQLSTEGPVDLSRTTTQLSGLNQADVKAALDLLAQIKQDLHHTDSLNRLDQKNAESTIELVEEELQKADPDRGLIDQAIDALSKGLAGVEKLATPTLRVAQLVATAMAL